MQWTRIESVLDRALELEGNARRRLLEEELGAALAQQFLEALEQDDSGDLLEVSPATLHQFNEMAKKAFLEAEDYPPEDGAVFLSENLEDEAARIDRIGRYRIVGKLGAGGMGDVFEGVRDDGEVAQRVAIKVVRAGRGEHWDARLRQEREILLQLRHRSITQLVDAGVLDDGRPFFAMELIEGESITEYCDQHDLDIHDRCRIMLQVLEALEHAHSRLVVHRDLKPTNVMVTRDGHVKLLDFGIAKLLEPDANPALTGSQLRLLTPDYAAPEQIEGQSASAATDVYGAGLLLYELLTGQKPFRGDSARKLEQAILSGALVRPSDAQAKLGNGTGAGQVPTRSAANTKQWSRHLRGDLDSVVLKALRTQPEDRYRSASAFRDDLQRVLDHMPVEARPPSWLYSARKFYQRHRAAVVTAGLGVLGLILMTVVALIQAENARIDRDRAQHAENTAREVNRFFIDDMLGATTPARAQGRDLSAKDLLVSAALRVDAYAPQIQSAGSEWDQGRAWRRQESVLRTRAALRGSLAESFYALGEWEPSQEQALKAIDDFDLLGVTVEESSDAALRRTKVEILLALLAEQRDGDASRGLSLLKNLDARVSTAADQSANLELTRLRVAAGLAQLEVGSGAFAAAAERTTKWLKEDRARRAVLLADTDSATAREILALSLLRIRALSRLSDTAFAVREAEKLLDEVSAHFGPLHTSTARVLNELGAAEIRDRRPAAAVATLTRTADVYEQLYGAAHPSTLAVLNRLGNALRGIQRFEEAVQFFERARTGYVELLGEDSLPVSLVTGGIGLALRNSGDPEAALPHILAAAEGIVRHRGDNHRDSLDWLRSVSQIYTVLGRDQDRLRTEQRILSMGQRALADPETGPSFLNGFAFWLLRRAPPSLRDPALAMQAATLARERSVEVDAYILDTLAIAQAELGDLDVAVQTQYAAVAAFGESTSIGALEFLQELLERTEKLDEAEAVWIDELARLDSVDAENHYKRLMLLVRHGGFLNGHGRSEEALQPLEQGLSVVLDREPAGTAYRYYVVRLYQELALAHLSIGAVEDATVMAQKAASELELTGRIYEDLHEKDRELRAAIAEVRTR